MVKKKKKLAKLSYKNIIFVFILTEYNTRLMRGKFKLMKNSALSVQLFYLNKSVVAAVSSSAVEYESC